MTERLSGAPRPATTFPQAVILFVAGETASSAVARRALLHAVGRVGLPESVVEVVDVFEAPERTLKDGVFVSPTLIIVRGGKQHRVVGALDADGFWVDLLKD